jgi:CBS domain-containing protein
MTTDTPSFLHLMAANALQADVPLNFRGEVVAEKGELLDLKKYGSRIFVDAARIFALASWRTISSHRRSPKRGRTRGGLCGG